MTHVVCEIVLSPGRWSHLPTRQGLRGALLRQFKGDLLTVMFYSPGDSVPLEMEVCVRGDEDSCELIRDELFELLLSFKPEYESMVEISLAID